MFLYSHANLTCVMFAGSCWVQVPPPSGVHLTQVAAGCSLVMAVDKNSEPCSMSLLFENTSVCYKIENATPMFQMMKGFASNKCDFGITDSDKL